MVDGAALKAIDVVISYAREDGERAKLVVEALRAKGFTVWWDKNLEAGLPFAKEIERALHEAAAVVVLWSSSAKKSPWVPKEASFAREHGKLVPVLLRKTALPLEFHDLHTLSLSRWPRAGGSEFEDLVAQIRRKIARRDAAAPAARPAPAVSAAPGARPKVVLIYAGKDGEVVHGKSRLRAFLEAVAKDENLEFWWDQRKRSQWDATTKAELQSATIVICLLSDSFFRSNFGRATETWNQLIQQGTHIVPVVYRKCAWHEVAWVKKLSIFPSEGKPVADRTDQFELFSELTSRIKRLLGRKEELLHGSALWTLRQVGQGQLGAGQNGRLQRDACRRAEHWVPHPKVRQQIVVKAKPMIKANKMRPLSKLELAILDDEILITDHERDPDPKRIRWVLRCANLHPQGRYGPEIRIAAF